MFQERASKSRLCAACLVAAAVAPTPISVLMAVEMAEAGPAVMFLALLTSFVGFVIAALHLVLAIPAYLLCRQRWRLDWWSSAIGGALIGGSPSLLLEGPEGAGLSALCGAVGGLAFWAVLRGTGRRDHKDLDETFA